MLEFLRSVVAVYNSTSQLSGRHRFRGASTNWAFPSAQFTFDETANFGTAIKILEESVESGLEDQSLRKICNRQNICVCRPIPNP